MVSQTIPLSAVTIRHLPAIYNSSEYCHGGIHPPILWMGAFEPTNSIRLGCPPCVHGRQAMRWNSDVRWLVGAGSALTFSACMLILCMDEFWDGHGVLFGNGWTMTEEEGYILGIEDAVGLNVEEIRHTPLDELRKRFEARDGGRRMRFLSEFPFIGRGSVLGDRLVPHEEAERAFASAVATLRG